MTNLFRFHLPYFIIKFFFLRNVKISINGSENIPKNQGFIIASNHEHSWDPILIMYGLKKHMHFLSIYSNFTKSLFKKKWLSNLEKSIFRDSIKGFVQRLSEQLPVSYNNVSMNNKSFLKANYYLGKKEIIGIFPEGELKLKKKKIFPGVAILAKKGNAKIVPLYIRNNAKNDSFLSTNFTEVKLNIGKPLKFSKSVDYTKNLVMEKIYALKND